MRRRTRGGRNIPTLTRRVTRRKQSANLALKAKEKANELIYKIQGLTSSKAKFKKAIFDILKVQQQPRNLDDYIRSVKFRLDEILKNPSEYLDQSTNDLTRLSEYADKLSKNTHDALNLSTKTPLSNRPNQIDNEEANRTMKHIQERTKENMSAQPSASPNILLEKMNLAVQIAHAMEYITYLFVVQNETIEKPISLQVRSILEKSIIKSKQDIRPFVAIESRNDSSTEIRKLLHVDPIDAEKKTGGIYAIFYWLVNATYTAWNTAIDAAKEYNRLSPENFFTTISLFEVHCHSSQYNLYLRIPIGTLFNTKNAPIPLGAIRFFKDTLLQWKHAEQQYKPEPSALLRFYLKKQIRLKFVKWLIVNHLNDRNSTKDYSPLFQDFDQEVRETEEWLQAHDPNRPVRPQGFVQSEVARIEQLPASSAAAASASVASSSAASPAAPVKQHMKVAAKPAPTKWNRSMYAPRLEQEKATAQAAAKAAAMSTKKM
jgi:hypothetical protein